MKKLLKKIASVLVVDVNYNSMFPYPGFAWAYGVAWKKPNVDGTVAMPIPLNLVACVVRGAWGRLRYPRRWMTFGDISAAYVAGLKFGLEKGLNKRITDEDIAGYLLRKKMADAGSAGTDEKQDEFFGRGQATLLERMKARQGEMAKLAHQYGVGMSGTPMWMLGKDETPPPFALTPEEKAKWEGSLISHKDALPIFKSKMP